MHGNEKRLTTLRLSKEYMKFSSAHFTIFSEHERERLHGHNFQVMAEVTTPVHEDDISFGYRLLKDIIGGFCDELDEYVLIPAKSPYLNIREQGAYYRIGFNDEDDMLLLKSDTLLLPVANSTVEAYSSYLLNRFLASEELEPHVINRVKIGVSSGPGQWGFAEWSSAS